MTAADTLQAQRERLNAGVKNYFAENADAAAWWSNPATSEEARATWQADTLKAARQNPELRGYAVYKESGFEQVLEKFAPQLGLTDAEREQVLENFLKGAAKYQDGASTAERFKQEFKDASLGIAGVGSVAGTAFDDAKFQLHGVDSLQSERVKLARLEAKRDTFPPESGQYAHYDKRAQSRAKLIEKGEVSLRRKGIEYLNTLATRQGEYTGMPGWEGVAQGAVALLGQFAGALASPENLVGGPGGKVAGSALKRAAVYGGRQAGENVTVNLLTEPAVQQKRIDEGMQAGFSGADAGLRSAMGAGLGGVMGGVRGVLPVRAIENLKAEGGPALDTPRASSSVVDEGSSPSTPGQTADLEPDPIVDAYLAKHGKHIDADGFRPLVHEGYASGWDGAFENSYASHKAASAASKRAYKRLLSRPPSGGPVLFTAGGGGSGKSYGMKQLAPELKGEADIVMDGTMAKHEQGRQKVQEALASGRDAQIVFTYMPTDQAWQMQVARTVTGAGRQVPAEVFAEAHQEALKSFIKQTLEWREDPRVDFRIIENRLGQEPQMHSGADVLPAALDLLQEQAQIDVLGNLNKLTEYGLKEARGRVETARSRNEKTIDDAELERRSARVRREYATGRGPGQGVDPLAEGRTGRVNTEEVASAAELPATEHPVIEVPLKRIRLGPENFKADADPKTGVVAGQELKSKKYERLGTPPIVLWERLDGKLEIITGRHRADLARRTGEATIPSQIVREADGFDAAQARTFDAESNIRDGQGTVRDYAHFFRNNGMSKTAAAERGLIDRVKGKDGWAIGREAGEDLYTLYRNKKISEKKAAGIARGAAGDDAVQRAAISKQRSMTADELEVFAGNLKRMREDSGPTATDQGDLFGADDSAIVEAEAIAKAAGKRMKANAERILAVRGAAKRPKVAREMGVDVKDPDAIYKEIERLTLENEALKQPGGELLQSLRVDADVSGKLESWADQVIEESSDRLFSGLDPKLMSAYAVKGSMILGRGVRDFAQWSAEMVKQLGDRVKPYLEDLYNEAKRLDARTQVRTAETDAAKQGEKVRGFSKRAAVDPREDAAAVMQDPSTRYTPQDLAEETSRLESLDDMELMGLLNDPDVANNISILAGIRLRERLLDRGEDASAVRRILEQKGTTLGQLIRQFREVRTSPANLVDLIGKELEMQGRMLTPEQRVRLMDLSRKQEAGRRKLEQARQSARQRFTEESGQQVAAAERELAAAARELDKYTHGLIPESTWDLLAKVMQGNLLTLRSLVQNVVGNLALAPMRGARNTLAATMDLIYSGATGKDRTLYQPVMSAPEQLAGAFEGLRSASQALLKGQGDASFVKGEVQRGFQPWRSLVQAWTGKDMAVDATTGRVRLGDRLRKVLEGMLGGPPEAMFRMLRLGDDPFRLGVRRGELANQAKLHGYEPGTLEYRQFMLVPPQRAAEAAERIGAQATFAQDNAFSKWIMTGEKQLEQLPGLGRPLKFLFKVVAPFRQFPVNYVAEALDYVAPPVALTKAILHGAKGNRREALEALGAAGVGATVWAVADYLWNKGLITPPIEWNDPKLKQLQYQSNAAGKPSGSLNVSGLERLLRGQSSEHVPGDKYVQYEGLGIPGMVLWMKSNGEFGDQKKRAVGKQPDNAVVDALKTFPEMTSFMLDQTFVAGVNSMMQALLDWDRYGEHLMGNLFRAVSSIPAPNALQSLNNARWDTIPELKADTVAETFANIWNYKTLQLAPDSPVKIDLWGEPVQRTPQGAQPYVYNMLDPLKWQSSNQDTRVDLLWKAWRQSGDTRVIPNAPGKRFFHQGGEYELNPEQQMQLQVQVGRARADLLDGFFPTADDLPDEAPLTVRMLGRIWDAGQKQGQAEFLGQVPLESLKRVGEHASLEAAVNPY